MEEEGEGEKRGRGGGRRGRREEGGGRREGRREEVEEGEKGGREWKRVRGSSGEGEHTSGISV